MAKHRRATSSIPHGFLEIIIAPRLEAKDKRLKVKVPDGANQLARA
jgi:hypothetical protein